MTEFIQSLNLEKILINVFSGTPDIFVAIAMMVIFGMAAFFRMTNLTMFLMIGIFFLIFVEFIDVSFVILLGIIGGLLIGYVISQMFDR